MALPLGYHEVVTHPGCGPYEGETVDIDGVFLAPSLPGRVTVFVETRTFLDNMTAEVKDGFLHTEMVPGSDGVCILTVRALNETHICVSCGHECPGPGCSRCEPECGAHMWETPWSTSDECPVCFDRGVQARVAAMKAEERFVNLSNHPSAKWSQAQLAAAQAHGLVRDIQFPNVPPQASESDIATLARGLIAQMREIVGRDDLRGLTAHIMGETSLVCELVLQLNVLRNDTLFRDGRGLRPLTVVCSTTERRVVEVDGVKTSVFEFVRFRTIVGVV